MHPFYEPEEDHRNDMDPDPDEGVTCDRCKEGNLAWHHTGVRWALIDENNRLHSCSGAKLDDFEDLTK